MPTPAPALGKRQEGGHLHRLRLETPVWAHLGTQSILLLPTKPGSAGSSAPSLGVPAVRLAVAPTGHAGCHLYRGAHWGVGTEAAPISHPWAGQHLLSLTRTVPIRWGHGANPGLSADSSVTLGKSVHLFEFHFLYSETINSRML